MTTDNLNTEVDSAEISALKNQVFILLVALVVISGTFMVYLYRQASLTGKDVNQLSSMLPAVVQKEQAINGFAGSLVTFGSKHPDFVPVLKKYNLAPATGLPGTGK